MEFFRKTLDPVFALAAIAVLDIFLFLLLGAWTVGGGETMMTGLIAQAVLGDDLQRIPFWNIVFPPHGDPADGGDEADDCSSYSLQQAPELACVHQLCRRSKNAADFIEVDQRQPL